MKRQILCAALMLVSACAFAGDYDWDTSTIGMHLGYGRGSSGWYDLNFGYLGSHNPSGMIAGVQAGFDRQFGSMVLGVYGDVSWAGIEGDHADKVFGTAPIPESDHSEIDALGTVTGRVGHAWGPTLLYGKGGIAWARTTHYLVGHYAPGQEFARDTTTRLGWTAGAGFEYAMATHWSAFFEYDFLGLGTHRIEKTVQGSGINPKNYQVRIDVQENVSLFKAGFGYRF